MACPGGHAEGGLDVQSAGSGIAGQAPNFDAKSTAAAQTASNVNTGVANAWLGNTNQITPYGSLTYNQTGTTRVGDQDVPQFTATQTLSPEQQQIYNKTTGLQSGALDTAKTVMGQVNNAVGTPLNFDNAPKMPGDQTQFRNDAYNALTARSNQDLDRSQSAQGNVLANQGIAAGSEAYNRAQEPINRARVDASNQGMLQAGNLAGQNLSQAQTLRNQSINETQSLRNQPLQDYATLMGLGGGVTNPTYAPGTNANIQSTDVTSPYIAQYQGQLQQYQAANQANQGILGGLFGLAGAGLGGWARSGFATPSDARIKENIARIGTAPSGLGIYAYNHIGDPTRRIGLMAQEVELVRPDAVTEIGGIKHVDYGKLV